jgi:hypothetical protein
MDVAPLNCGHEEGWVKVGLVSVSYARVGLDRLGERHRIRHSHGRLLSFAPTVHVRFKKMHVLVAAAAACLVVSASTGVAEAASNPRQVDLRTFYVVYKALDCESVRRPCGEQARC